MFGYDNINGKRKDLENQRDSLVEELNKLEEMLSKKKVEKDIYKKKRHEIERKIVEVMDRLAQLKFLSG